MIRHIVFFSAKRQEDIIIIEQGLSLLAAIAESNFFEVCRNSKTDALSNEIDIVVHTEFVDEAALARYKQHPNYQKSIELVRPLRNIRIAVDYETKGNSSVV